jgi:hypothetical protein
MAKCYSLAAIRDAHALAGRRVIGLAPTNAVAQDLKADGSPTPERCMPHCSV